MSDYDPEQEEWDAVFETMPEKELAELWDLVVDNSQGTCPEMTFHVNPDVSEDDNGKLVADAWEIVIYEVWSELVGGKGDGAQVYSGWFACLAPLFSVLGPPDDGSDSPIPHIHWCCDLGLSGEHRIPHLSISGTYKGFSVIVTLLARPPDDQKPRWRILPNGHMTPIEDEDDYEDEEDEEDEENAYDEYAEDDDEDEDPTDVAPG